MGKLSHREVRVLKSMELSLISTCPHTFLSIASPAGLL